LIKEVKSLLEFLVMLYIQDYIRKLLLLVINNFFKKFIITFNHEHQSVYSLNKDFKDYDQTFAIFLKP